MRVPGIPSVCSAELLAPGGGVSVPMVRGSGCNPGSEASGDDSCTLLKAVIELEPARMLLLPLLSSGVPLRLWNDAMDTEPALQHNTRTNTQVDMQLIAYYEK